MDNTARVKSTILKCNGNKIDVVDAYLCWRSNVTRFSECAIFLTTRGICKSCCPKSSLDTQSIIWWNNQIDTGENQLVLDHTCDR
jgi:hypothetical protein